MANDNGALTRALPCNALFDLLYLCQQTHGGVVIALAQCGDIQAASGAIEQTRAESTFQLHQATTDVLLGNAQLFGRRSEAARFKHLDEKPHVFESVHRHSLVDNAL
jgi:hypothetical protein